MRVLTPAEAGERAPDGVLVLTTGPEPGAAIELWELRDGTRVVVGYTTFTALAASAGAGQPFRRLTTAELARVCGAAEVRVLLDELLPGGPRHPEPDVAGQPNLPLLEEAEPAGDLLYVPSRPSRPGDAEVGVELQRYRNRATMLAYTSAQALEAGCGPHQPWVSIPARVLDAVLAECGAEQVLLNPVLSEGSRHVAPVVDWTRKPRRETEWNA
ncbi:hypothetical protein BAY59_35775 [Prauserella coralliicola]|nr:hypothetical protein BAY59_35775 [Prauserella coralliicola]